MENPNAKIPSPVIIFFKLCVCAMQHDSSKIWLLKPDHVELFAISRCDLTNCNYKNASWTLKARPWWPPHMSVPVCPWKQCLSIRVATEHMFLYASKV